MKILFLCVANSARSIMAEGIAKHHWGDKHEFYSAGSNPANPHPMALKTLAKLGISTDNYTSDNITDYDLNQMDHIITLCAEEYCPIVPGNKLHWPFPDPFGKDQATTEDLFLETSTNIKNKLSHFMESL